LTFLGVLTPLMVLLGVPLTLGRVTVAKRLLGFLATLGISTTF